jgi:hypothetical protein
MLDRLFLEQTPVCYRLSSDYRLNRQIQVFDYLLLPYWLHLEQQQLLDQLPENPQCYFKY